MVIKPKPHDPHARQRCQCGHQKNMHEPTGGACAIIACGCLEWHRQALLFNSAVKPAKRPRSWTSAMPNHGRIKR